MVVSESAGSLSSVFLHQALLLDLYIQTIRELSRDGSNRTAEYGHFYGQRVIRKLSVGVERLSTMSPGSLFP